MPTISGTVTDTNGSPASGYTIRFYRRDNGVLLGETLTGTGAAIPVDSDWDKVSILIRGGRANGANLTVADTGQDVTGSPSVAYSNSILGISGTQLLFTGSTDGIVVIPPIVSGGTYPTGGKIQTMEGFITPDASQTSGFQFWGFQGSASSNVMRLSVSSTGRIAYEYRQTGSYQTAQSAAGVITLGQRHFVRVHMDLDSATSTIKILVDGAEVVSGVVTTGTPGLASTNSGAPVYLRLNGYANNGTLYNGTYIGAMEEVRLTHSLLRTSPSVPAATWPGPSTGASSTVGTYSFITSYTGEVNVVCLDNAAGTVENDLILRTNVT